VEARRRWPEPVEQLPTITTRPRRGAEEGTRIASGHGMGNTTLHRPFGRYG
jgi:hypothetical protein